MEPVRTLVNLTILLLVLAGMAELAFRYWTILRYPAAWSRITLA